MFPQLHIATTGLPMAWGGTRRDSNQELIGQGIANVVVPLFGGVEGPLFFDAIENFGLGERLHCLQPEMTSI